MLFRSVIILLFLTITAVLLNEVNAYHLSHGYTRRFGEYENAICQPRKKHLDLDGCGECICNPHGYGSICEEISCSEVHKRPISQRECTPYRDFKTHCHYCQCTPGGIPIDCEEKHRGCMDRLLERLQYERLDVNEPIYKLNRRPSQKISTRPLPLSYDTSDYY